MGDFQAYGLNVILHASLLSIAAWLVVKCFKNPHARTLSATLGLLGVALLPWISGMRVHPESALLVTPVEMPVFVSRPFDIPETRGLADEPEIATQAQAQVPEIGKSEWSLPHAWSIITAVWALGCGFMMARQGWVTMRLARWTKSLRLATSEERSMVERYLSCAVRVAPPGTSPFVTGCFKPLLVIPEDLLAEERRRELIWASGHEAGHLRGHDLQWLALFQVIRAVFWWNPLVHRLVRLWAEAREQVCDHLALTEVIDRRDYCSFLVSLGSRRMSGIVMPMAARDTVVKLKRRIAFVMEGGTYRSCGRRFVAGGMAVSVGAGAALCQIGCKAPAPGGAVTGVVIGKSASASSGSSEPWSRNFEVPMIHFHTLLAISPKPVVKNGQVLSPDAFEKLWERLLSEQTNELNMLSSVTSRNQKEVVMELGREIDKSGRISARPLGGDETSGSRSPALDDPSYRFVGIRMALRIMSAGDDIDLSCRGVYRGYPAMSWAAFKGFVPFPPTDPAVLKNISPNQASARSRLRPREWICIDFGEVMPGRFATVFCQVKPESRIGKPAADFRPLPAVKFRAKAWLLEGDPEAIALSKKAAAIPVALESYPASTVDEIRRSTKGTITDLPPLEIQTGSPPATWAQLPGIPIFVNHLSTDPKGMALGLAISLSEEKCFYGATEPGKVMAVEIPAAVGKGSRVLFISEDRTGR